MRSIAQVSIVYMVAALLCAQPMVRGITSIDTPKPYLTIENYAKAAVGTAAVALVLYSLIQLATMKEPSSELRLEYNPSGADSVHGVRLVHNPLTRLEEHLCRFPESRNEEKGS